MGRKIMELIEVICKAHFEDTRIGAVSRKQVVRVPIHVAKELASLDLVTIKDPLPAVSQVQPRIEVALDGGEEPPMSLPEAQVSISETPKPSRRGRRTRVDE
jgi:hypothetical protein